MMYKWLPLNLSANIPVYAHTMIGVGGLVVNDKKQILTIKENNAIVKGAWKLPGGYVEPSKTFVSFDSSSPAQLKLVCSYSKHAIISFR